MIWIILSVWWLVGFIITLGVFKREEGNVTVEDLFIAAITGLWWPLSVLTLVVLKYTDKKLF